MPFDFIDQFGAGKGNRDELAGKADKVVVVSFVVGQPLVPGDELPEVVQLIGDQVQGFGLVSGFDMEDAGAHLCEGIPELNGGQQLLTGGIMALGTIAFGEVVVVMGVADISWPVRSVLLDDGGDTGIVFLFQAN